jgi:hypothetical protein
VVLNDTVIYDVVGFCIIFAPELAESNGGPIPDYQRITLGEHIYKTVFQIIDQARGAYPVIPAFGGSARGSSKPTYGYPMIYGTVWELFFDYGMQLRCYLNADKVFGGERATATFYCLEVDSDKT